MRPRMDRLSASAVLDPRGVAGLIPSRGDGARPWALYRKVPELRAGIEWIANTVSRADLYVAELTEDGPERVEDPQIAEIMAELFDNGPSQSDMLKNIIKNLETAGEVYVVPYRDESGEIVWTTASVREVRSVGNEMELQTDVTTWVPIDGSQLIRMWYRDPEFSWRAESPVIAMEPVLQSIISGTARQIAIDDSRLAGNGFLALSENLRVEQPASEGHANPAAARDFVSAFDEAMMAPMEDRGLASAIVPIIITGPKEDLPTKDSWVTMSSPLDERASEQLMQNLRRMAMSMGIPPEIILGLGESNYWNSFAIIREAVTSGVEPRLDIIASGFLEAFLRPRLAKAGYDPKKYVILADVTDLVVPPDRSEAAQGARAQGLLTDQAWARYSGFEESDIPTGSERERIILERVMFAEPTFAPWILDKLGIDVPGLTTSDPAQVPLANEAGTALEDEAQQAAEQAAADGSQGEGPRTMDTMARDAPSAPEGTPPEGMSASVEGTVVAAVETAVLRVLERSNNRLVRAHDRTRRACLKDVQITNAHAHRDERGDLVFPMTHDLRKHMLKGAYDVWGSNMPSLVPIVSSYVDYLYDNQIPHSRELLTETLMSEALFWPGEEVSCA